MGKAIPIRLVEKRRKHLKFGSMNESTYYPLYKTYNSIYNYENIKDSIHNWTAYSNSMGSNLNKLMELYSMVIDKGNLSQLQEITNFLKEEVSYIESPYVLKKQLSSISEDNEYVQDVLTSIVENTECDRLIKNYNAVSKRFNVEKFVRNNIVHEDSIVDGIYGLCSLIDTYNMDIPSRFCISAEMSLYAVDKFNGYEIPKSTILENVIDYYLVNYGANDFDRFFDTMSKSCNKDLFIQEEGIQYLEYLKNIRDNFVINEDGSYGFVDKEYSLEEDSSTFYLDLMLEYTNTDNPKSVSYTPLVEFSFSDMAKNIITKIKLAPVKTVALFKEGIRALFVTTRLQDIATGTKNALSICFYGFIILAVISFSIVVGLLVLIVTLIISKCVNKEYLKSAIQEWKEHKYSVERKIRECTDPEKKRKLEAYHAKIEECIEKLENKYEEMRDKTANEIDSSVRMKNDLHGNSIVNSIKAKLTFSDNKLIDPQGNEVDISGNNPSNNNPSSNDKSKPYIPENSTENDDLAEYERYMRERNAEKHKR